MITKNCDICGTPRTLKHNYKKMYAGLVRKNKEYYRVEKIVVITSMELVRKDIDVLH